MGILRPLLFMASAALAASLVSAKYEVKMFLQPITSFDGTVLHCDGFVPIRPSGDNSLFPLIIYPNSWGAPQIEYVLKALNYAEDGYVTLEYETRGWYFSGGEVDVAGPLDQKDGAAVLEWALARASEWNINTSAVAFMGISYGAGISLLMAGTDPRVTTALSLSGWSNLTRALYLNQAPSQAVINELVQSAKKLGHVSQELLDVVADIFAHRNISYVEQWTAKRGAGTFLDAINKRKVPLFLSHNMADPIFDPMQQLEFFSVLQGPKFMLLNQGDHAEPEVFGDLDIGNNYIWGKAKLFLDHVLKGLPTGIFQEPLLQVERGRSILSRDYVFFSSWPSTNVSAVPLQLTARGAARFGGLSGFGAAHGGGKEKKTVTAKQRRGVRAAVDEQMEHPKVVAIRKRHLARADAEARRITKATGGDASPWTPHFRAGAADSIAFTKDPPLTEGTGSQKEEQSFGIPINFNLTAASPQTSIVYVSTPVSAAALLCGVPELSLSVTAPGPRWQVYAYLYDVDPATMIGRLISNGVWTRWENGPGAFQINNWQLRALCTSIEVGHSVGLGLVLYNSEYQAASESGSLQFSYGPSTVLTLPVNL